MRLLLVRHGETDWVRKGLYQGATDVALNRQGLAQARRVARAIQKEKPFAVYCSEMVRAQQTCSFIASACRQKPIIDPRLNEISFGVWEGIPYREIRKRFPKQVHKWYHTSWTSCPSGGESLKSLRKRVSSFLSQVVDKFKHRDGTCVLVTHGGPIRMFLLELLEIPVSLFWTIRVDPASISAVNIRQKYTEITLLNCQAHLNGVHSVL